MKIILLLCFFNLSLATVWQVPSEVPTIKEAVEKYLMVGDSLKIAPGIYKEHNIDISSKFVEIIGSGMDKTIIDAEGSGRIFAIYQSCHISSLTLMNGKLEGVDERGAGIYKFWSTSMRIENVRFKNCVSNSQGGAFFSERNEDLQYDYMDINTGITFNNCIFERNSAVSGGAVCVGREYVGLVNCLFFRNHAEEGASALDILEGTESPNHVTHCTFANNSGIAVYYKGIVRSTNTIYHNSNIKNEAQKLHIANDCINSELELTSPDLFVKKNNGIIYEDPLFVDEEADDYHLQRISPCINAVSPNSHMPSKSDFTRGYGALAKGLDGNTRMGPDACYCRDIGAYEYHFDRCNMEIVEPTVYRMSQGRLAADTSPIVFIIKDSSLNPNSYHKPTYRTLLKPTFKVKVYCEYPAAKNKYDTCFTLSDENVTFKKDTLKIYPPDGVWDCYEVHYRLVDGLNVSGERVKGKNSRHFKPVTYTIIAEFINNEEERLFARDSVKMEIFKVPVNINGHEYYDSKETCTSIDSNSIIFSFNGERYNIDDPELGLC